MARFVPPELVGQIFLIVNDAHETEVAQQVEANLSSFGPHASRVRIVCPDEIILRHPTLMGRINQFYVRRYYGSDRHTGWRKNPGWKLQQAFKLLSVHLGNSPYICILDAKNMFLSPVTFDDFFTEDGRAKSYLSEASELYQRWATQSFKVLGMVPPDQDRLPPTVTPYPVTRAFLQDAVSYLTRRLGPLEWFFVCLRWHATEFMLLFAYAEMKGGWDRYFQDGMQKPATAFRGTSEDDLNDLLNRALSGDVQTFALHRARFAGLSEAQRQKIIDLWCSAGIVDDTQEAKEITNRLAQI
ncbi:DUF6492 family protein [Loktanella agnita]|uniref:DUF6492 family protein n=1 Tax=Loktanella agnita TaxID=287097 RepID=UPI00398A306F